MKNRKLGDACCKEKADGSYFSGLNSDLIKVYLMSSEQELLGPTLTELSDFQSFGL